MYEYKWNTVPTMERTILCLHILKADQFYYPHGVRRGGYLELVDGKFGKHVESLPEGADVLDYSGYSIAPGLVDTHIHGFGGVDVMDNNIEGTLHTMSEGLLSTGVTSFCLRP